MFKEGDEVNYGKDSYVVINAGIAFSDIERIKDGLRRLRTDNAGLYLAKVPTTLSIAKEPTIQLSYNLKIKGYHLNFTHKELKEIQTLLNGILL